MSFSKHKEQIKSRFSLQIQTILNFLLLNIKI